MGRAWPAGLVALFVCAFCGLAWFSVQHVNTLWDEANDHVIALSLMERPLTGSGLDGTQARLPMYVTAGAYALTGPSPRVARAVSIAMGALAIVLTFAAGRRWSGMAAGLLAAGLLSVAPYFLTFARTGFTEGDAFCPAVTLLMLLAFDRYLERRDTIRLVTFGAALGLALATKFYAVFFVPPLVLCDVVDARRRSRQSSDAAIRVIPSGDVTGRDSRVWAWAGVSLAFLAAVAAQTGIGRVAVVLWAGVVVLLAAGPVDQYLLAPPERRTSRLLTRWSPRRGWLVALPVAAIVCAAVCPAHLLNPEILRALARSLVYPVEAEPMGRIIDPARLYGGVILLKLGPLLGVLSIAALAWACAQRAGRPISVAAATVALYLAALLLLPIRQSFYLMSVYPLIVLILAAFVVHVAERLLARERALSAWIAISITGCVYLLWGTVRCYPEFGYFGYALVGRNWLSAESSGYRNLVQVTNDGTEDVMQWLQAHVPPGRRVVSYLWDDHVMDAWLADRPPAFHLVRRNAFAARHNPPDIDDADYLVLHLNNYVSYADAPGRRELVSCFGPRPVHVIERGRGAYRTTVVQVFSRVEGTASRPSAGEVRAE